MPLFTSTAQDEERAVRNAVRNVRFHLITKPRDFSTVAIGNFDDEGVTPLLFFAGIILVTGRGTEGVYADVVINIYDNNGPNGRHLCPTDMRINSSNSPFSYDQTPPLYCESGYIYVEWVTEGNGNWQIVYDV